MLPPRKKSKMLQKISNQQTCLSLLLFSPQMLLVEDSLLTLSYSKDMGTFQTSPIVNKKWLRNHKFYENRTNLRVKVQENVNTSVGKHGKIICRRLQHQRILRWIVSVCSIVVSLMNFLKILSDRSQYHHVFLSDLVL